MKFVPAPITTTTTAAIAMFSAAAASLSRSATAFVVPSMAGRTTSRSLASATRVLLASEGQAEVVLVGCGAPNRGMGWYHAVQMLDNK